MKRTRNSSASMSLRFTGKTENKPTTTPMPTCTRGSETRGSTKSSTAETMIRASRTSKISMNSKT